MTTCIFDLDGVIVDTAKYHYLAWKKLARQLGIDLTEKMNESLKGVGRIESLNLILEMGKLEMSEVEKEALTSEKNTWFVEYIQGMKKEEIFPGVKSLIKELREQGIKVGLASSSKNAKTVLKLLGIEGEFEAVVDGNMIEHSKPNPEIFLKAAGILQAKPTDCIVIEDAEAGVEAAKLAGMKCVGIGNAAQLGKADYIVDRIDKLKYEVLNNL